MEWTHKGSNETAENYIKKYEFKKQEAKKTEWLKIVKQIQNGTVNFKDLDASNIFKVQIFRFIVN